VPLRSAGTSSDEPPAQSKPITIASKPGPQSTFAIAVTDELLHDAYRALTGWDADSYSRKDPRWKEPVGARAVCA
jgi:hypothetical protein